jgi:hypothetical protein
MKGLMKSVLIIGKLFNLLIGDSFTIPTSEVMVRFPQFRFLI